LSRKERSERAAPWETVRKRAVSRQRGISQNEIDVEDLLYERYGSLHHFSERFVPRDIAVTVLGGNRERPSSWQNERDEDAFTARKPLKIDP